MTSHINISATRKQSDFTKLLMAGYDLELIDGNMQEFNVTFHGPHGTLYEGGVWKVHVTLPDDYPFASPSIGFLNKMLHPNVDESSGSVCLDVINETWTPIYSLVNVFDTFLPQLLTYPNPNDPLNNEAAALLMTDRCSYEQKVREHVKKHASKEDWQKNLLKENGGEEHSDIGIDDANDIDSDLDDAEYDNF